MDIKEYSVIEAAKLLNVTRQSIYNKLNSLKDILQPHIKIKNNTKYLTRTAVDIIKKDLNKENVKNVNYELYNDVNANLTDVYKCQIEDLHKTIDTVKEVYEKQIEFIKLDYEKQIEYVKSESQKKTHQLENKDKLLENMQVLLREQKLLIEEKDKSTWWKFWKKRDFHN